MAEKTGIAWTDHTFNPWWGCSKVSQGCKNCYAETLSARFHGDRLWGVNGDRKIASEATWREPQKWNRQAEAAGVRRRVFCASMADVFEYHTDPEVNAKLDAARARLFAMVEALKYLDFLFLTKRPGNILRMVPAAWRENGAPSNVWLGASVCGDKTDEAMVGHLMFASASLHAAVAFLSYEPAIGPPDFLGSKALDGIYAHQCEKGPAGEIGTPADGAFLCCEICNDTMCKRCYEPLESDDPGFKWGIDWIIVGGESGPGARPFRAEWARAVVEYGAKYSIPVFVKQMGAAFIDEVSGVAGHAMPGPSPDLGITVRHLKHRAGADPSEWPEDLRVQQFPEP